MDDEPTELNQSEKEKPFRKEYSDLEPVSNILRIARIIPLATQYKPIMPVHFDELNKIWPENPRIPSVQSRKAWALARGLNPVNVNNWWYRRRKVAKKLKFSIPRDTYELEVGNPPLIPAPIIKEEPKVVVLDCTEPGEDHVGDDDHTVTSPETHIPGSDDTYFSMDSTIAPSSPIMADKDTMKIITDEDHAYISPKEHLCNYSTPSSPSISLNSFPCELFLHSDNPEDVYYTAARPLCQFLVAGSLEDQGNRQYTTDTRLAKRLCEYLQRLHGQVLET
uniref:Homeobox domain-containing protein n=1 Tax=Psilocybe cubensis TaxID=181762 RepID=A0A8H8CEB4_PSICU